MYNSIKNKCGQSNFNRIYFEKCVRKIIIFKVSLKLNTEF